MADKHISAGTDKWRATPINPSRSKIDYSVLMEFEHPDHALNQEYMDAGAADDRERPLCFGVHSGIICRRLAKRRSRFCYLGRGDV